MISNLFNYPQIFIVVNPHLDLPSWHSVSFIPAKLGQPANLPDFFHHFPQPSSASSSDCVSLFLFPFCQYDFCCFITARLQLPFTFTLDVLPRATWSLKKIMKIIIFNSQKQEKMTVSLGPWTAKDSSCATFLCLASKYLNTFEQGWGIQILLNYSSQ